MKKVFHFDAPREKYFCDAAILWCFDNRFELGFHKFLKRIGVVHLLSFRMISDTQIECRNANSEGESTRIWPAG
jgi:hypothetical protein